ncbi:transcriptional regulator with XRE-family HTH domain [Bacillus sp. TE9106W]|uniref:helix-turn-helix domain-containing protein n=1 Tax=Bacillus cereus TaxID=1396 RepID=UPI000A3027A3|nr:helix-turn-helix domain-containing protein [Bacillus cereus]SMD82002.1 HTH-type transcriptional repressor RghR [Bacillus cereus]
MEKVEFGTLVRKYRKEKGLTLADLGEIVELSHPYLSQIELGKRNPSLDIVRKLSEALEVDFTELAWRAGFYTDAEIQQKREMEAFYNSMTPEEEEAYIERDMKHSLLHDYRQLHYPDLKVLLNGGNVFFDGKSLNYEQRQTATKILEVLFEKLEVNCPSDEDIEKEYDDMKNFKFTFLNQDSSDRDKDK